MYLIEDKRNNMLCTIITQTYLDSIYVNINQLGFNNYIGTR